MQTVSVTYFAGAGKPGQKCEVKGWLSQSGFLAVTPALADGPTARTKKGWYHVTHVPTGLTLGGFPLKRNRALKVMRLADDPGWNFTEYMGSEEQLALKEKYLSALDETKP